MKNSRPQYEHFIVLIQAQDQWKEKDYSKITDKSFESYINSSGHQGECDICLTCPICRSNWDLFNPYNLGEYNILCPICKEFLKIFEKLKGQNDGLILLSHNIMSNEHMKGFVENMLVKEKVKKVYLFYHERKKHQNLKNEFYEKIRQKEVKKREFLEILEAEAFQKGLIYEILKDKYW